MEGIRRGRFRHRRDTDGFGEQGNWADEEGTRISGQSAAVGWLQ